MKNNTRKIVVLNKLDSPSIEQAIFILREEGAVSAYEAVNEAQRIVDAYVKSLSRPAPKSEHRRKLSSAFLIGMTLYTFTTVILTAYLLNFIK